MVQPRTREISHDSGKLALVDQFIKVKLPTHIQLFHTEPCMHVLCYYSLTFLAPFIAARLHPAYTLVRLDKVPEYSIMAKSCLQYKSLPVLVESHTDNPPTSMHTG